MVRDNGDHGEGAKVIGQVVQRLMGNHSWWKRVEIVTRRRQTRSPRRVLRTTCLCSERGRCFVCALFGCGEHRSRRFRLNPPFTVFVV